MANLQALPQANIERRVVKGATILVGKLVYRQGRVTFQLTEGNCAAILGWSRRVGVRKDQAGNYHLVLPYFQHPYHLICGEETALLIRTRGEHYLHTQALAKQEMAQPTLL